MPLRVVGSELAPFPRVGMTSVPRTSAVPTLTTLTGGAANTPGSYSQLIASTGAATDMMVVYAVNTFQTGVSTPMLIDIATGAAASEAIVIASINAGFRPAALTGGGVCDWGSGYVFPIRIPAGTRIAARCAGLNADTVDVSVELYSGGHWKLYPRSTVIAYGADTANSRGTVVASGLSDAEGSWTQITAATTAYHRSLGLSIGGAADTTFTGNDYAIDIGIGAAASEVAIISDRFFRTTANEVVIQSTASRFIEDLNIPSGTRLAARISGPDAGAQSFDVVLHGA